VTVRPAGEADLELVRELWLEFTAEIPEPHFVQETWEESGIAENVRAGTVLIIEEGGRALGFAEAEVHTARLGWLHTLYVRPEARRAGAARLLLSEVVALLRARGVGHVGLEVTHENAVARTFYDRIGFVEFSSSLAIELDELDRRLRAPEGPTYGRAYVQIDDRERIEIAVREFVPRLGRSPRTDVHAPENGWVAVDDELCSGEPDLLRRLARELSARTGAVVLTLGIEDGAVVRYVLFDRGQVADEYASVPEHFGPLPPGDVVALSANPTVAARLTGSDPARLKEIALTAATAAELPPAEQLLAGVAAVLGVSPPRQDG
jgi:ribosomal protein S18 acetylase RimI-like enzyme